MAGLWTVCEFEENEIQESCRSIATRNASVGTALIRLMVGGVDLLGKLYIVMCFFWRSIVNLDLLFAC